MNDYLKGALFAFGIYVVVTKLLAGIILFLYLFAIITTSTDSAVVNMIIIALSTSIFFLVSFVSGFFLPNFAFHNTRVAYISGYLGLISAATALFYMFDLPLVTISSQVVGSSLLLFVGHRVASRHARV